jgi:hypothetical protein
MLAAHYVGYGSEAEVEPVLMGSALCRKAEACLALQSRTH